MKRFILVFFVLFISSAFIAQSTIEEYVREGIQYHDKGDFDKAISSYKKALKIDSKSSITNYEIALTYFQKGNYEKVVKHTDIVLKQDKKYLMEAYLAKGSALDLLGRTQESIKLFEKAIKKTDGHYLLNYNLALNHYKLNDFGKAEEHAIEAIEINPNHGSSHLLLVNIHNIKGNKVQTLLAAHFFLMIEPASNRSKEVLDILLENFGANISTDGDDTKTITINLDPTGDDEFMAAELMIGMLGATKTLEENEGKTEDEMFIENTQSFFKIMGELKEDKHKSIYWTFYTPFFYDIAKSDHMETYCKHITRSDNELSSIWLSENVDKLESFNQWLQDK